MKSNALIRRLLLSGLLGLILSGCEQHPSNPSADATAGPPEMPPPRQVAATEPEPTPDSVELAQQAQAEKREAFEQLQPVIRRFERKRTAYRVAEQEYQEKLYLWTLTFTMLEVRSNPGTFAGDLPSHEVFAYSEYEEAAETLFLEVGVYLERRTRELDPEVADLRRWRQEAQRVLALPFPSSGSRLQDAVMALREPGFKAVVTASNARLAQVATEGGGHVARSVGDGADKVFHYLDSLLKANR